MTGTVLDFELPGALEAHEPPEARGLTRDGVRLLVGETTGDTVTHHRFTDLPDLLRAGDVLVVNTSGTMPAAVPIPRHALTVHLSTEQPDGTWLVELRRNANKATTPYPGGEPGQRYPLPGGAQLVLRQRYSRERLWIADLRTGGFGSVQAFLRVHGMPIRYGYVHRNWPIAAYQTVFATHEGSAEMPSAARPFTNRLVTRLVSAGVQVAPILLHTGVASPEAHERPYPERFSVSATTARVVNQARAAGGRVIAVGTTAVRALESAADDAGTPHATNGWTELIITPDRGVRVVDGLITGFHEPRASHLDMLAAIAPTALLRRCYAEAIDAGYLWHEFGDLNLLLA
ncbi:MAG TPA: S-adenosylmethionine:tRNA ribosyltransferase-isomerase [Pseudonocardiaceae bacterium]|nr:S-adenosylmethionine:tRNA ribosyltransferase-isomerase [Pseudonocardiaceae bacterium]